MSDKISKKDLAGMAMTAADFAALKGEVKTGAGYLKLEPGQAAGPFKFTRILAKQVLDPANEPVDLHEATDADGTPIRMPASAIFRGQMAELAVKPGDVFYVLRSPDVIKKKGRGKGRPMAAFVVKITARAKK